MCQLMVTGEQCVTMLECSMVKNVFKNDFVFTTAVLGLLPRTLRGTVAKSLKRTEGEMAGEVLLPNKVILYCSMLRGTKTR